MLILQILFAYYQGNLRLTSHVNKAFHFVSVANTRNVRVTAGSVTNKLFFLLTILFFARNICQIDQMHLGRAN
jgi:hypothetical protein